MVQWCGGSLFLRGAVHSRTYLFSNKPKARLAEKVRINKCVEQIEVKGESTITNNWSLTAAEEGCGFYGDHEGSDASRGAGAEQGPRRRASDKYTLPITFPISV